MIDTNKQITLAGEKADDFIRLGHALAQKLRDAQNLRTLEAMAQELRTISDALDAYFGGENGKPGGSSLSTALWVAYDWQKNTPRWTARCAARCSSRKLYSGF